MKKFRNNWKLFETIGFPLHRRWAVALKKNRRHNIISTMLETQSGYKNGWISKFLKCKKKRFQFPLHSCTIGLIFVWREKETLSEWNIPWKDFKKKYKAIRQNSLTAGKNSQKQHCDDFLSGFYTILVNMSILRNSCLSFGKKGSWLFSALAARGP